MTFLAYEMQRGSQLQFTVTVYNHSYSLVFVVIRRALYIRNYFKPNIVRKIMNTDLYCLISIWFERVKSGDYLQIFH